MWWFEYNGDAIPITNMFDIDGDATENPAEAVRFVAGPLPDGTWVGVDRVQPGDIKPLN